MDKHNVNLVLEINVNDVLCGRGVPVITNLGNVRFRHLVRARKEEYVSNWRTNMKHRIALEILNQIHCRQGRFLRVVSSTKLKERFGIAANVRAWKEISEQDALEKIKQALRAKKGTNLCTTTPPTPRISENQRTSDLAVRNENAGTHSDTMAYATAECLGPASMRMNLAHLLPQTARENRDAGAGRTLHPFMWQQQRQQTSLQKEAQMVAVEEHTSLSSLYGDMKRSSSRLGKSIVPNDNRQLGVHLEAAQASASVAVGRGDAYSPIRGIDNDAATPPLPLETRLAATSARSPRTKRHIADNAAVPCMENGDPCTQRSTIPCPSRLITNHELTQSHALFAPHSPPMNNARYRVPFASVQYPSVDSTSSTTGQVCVTGVPLPSPPPLSPNSIVHHANAIDIVRGPQDQLSGALLNHMHWTRINSPSASASATALSRVPSVSTTLHTAHDQALVAAIPMPSRLGTATTAARISTNNRTSDDERLLLECFAHCMQAVDRLSDDEVHELLARHMAVQLEERRPPPRASASAQVASVQLCPRPMPPITEGLLTSFLPTSDAPPQLPLCLFHERNGTPVGTTSPHRGRLPSTTIPTKARSSYGAFVGGVSGVAPRVLPTPTHYPSSQLDVLAEVAAMATIGTANKNSTNGDSYRDVNIRGLTTRGS